ncbi:MAG: GNAT family N-acetyltransferase [Rubrivivax sp.]
MAIEAAAKHAPFVWSTTDAPARADLDRLQDAVTAHGRALAADGDARPLACLLHDHDGRLVAGASGRTEYGRLFVAYLWVDVPLRRRGWGAQVLQRLQAAARQRGCVDAVLETLSDHTAAWYARQGWRTVGYVPRWVGPFNRHLLLKPLIEADRLRIGQETPDQPEVLALIDELDAYQKPLYPPESHHGIDIAALLRPEVVFAVARNAQGLAVGIGALVLDGDGSGELKRMYLQPSWRGGGRAQALLAFLQDAGRARGCRVFRLETGIHQHEALAFYQRAGYARRGPFGDYQPDPLSVFMEKTETR